MLYIHQVLHKALGQAIKWGLLSRNVTKLAEPSRNKRKIPETLTVAQVRILLDSLKEVRLYPLYVLAVSTGMREGKLLGLQWEDGDLEMGLITIRHRAQEIRGQGMIIKEPKTESSKRLIDIPERALEALKQLEEASGQKKGLVFHTKNNTPFTQRNLLRQFHQSLAKEGCIK